MKDFAHFPVFVDLVYERHRSSLIAAISVLRLLIWLFLEFVVPRVATLDYTTTCAERTGTLSPAAASTTEALYISFVISSALASAYANTFRWVYVGLALAGPYLGLLVKTEFVPCCTLIADGTGDGNAITTIVVVTFDVTFTSLTLLALMWLVLLGDAPRQDGGDGGAGRASLLLSGRRSSGGWLHDPKAVLAAAGAGLPACIPDSVRRIVMGAHVAPLRHIVASTLAFTFCLAVTIVAAILGPQQAEKLISDVWNPAVDQYNHFYSMVVEAIHGPAFPTLPLEIQEMTHVALDFADRIADFMNNEGIAVLGVAYNIITFASIGASMSCVVILLSMSASYKYIYEDYIALDDVVPKLPVAEADAASKPLVANDDGGTFQPPPDFADHNLESGSGKDFDGLAKEHPLTRYQSIPLPGVQPGAASSAAAASARSCGTSCGACIACCTPGRTVLRGTNGTPDITSTAITFFAAFNYASLYVINIITAWALLTVLFGAILFFLFSGYFEEYALTTGLTLLLSTVYMRVLSWLLGLCVARNNSVMRPRLLLLCDLALTLTLGAAVGITVGIARFLMGVVVLVFRLTVLARPVLPSALASFDSGYVAYAGIVKSAWAARLSPGSAPVEPLRVVTCSWVGRGYM